jgi:hypothetical protein
MALEGLDKHLSNIFIACAVFASLCCFARADYNLPLFAFLYLMWNDSTVSE